MSLQSPSLQQSLMRPLICFLASTPCSKVGLGVLLSTLSGGSVRTRTMVPKRLPFVSLSWHCSAAKTLYTIRFSQISLKQNVWQMKSSCFHWSSHVPLEPKNPGFPPPWALFEVGTEQLSITNSCNGNMRLDCRNHCYHHCSTILIVTLELYCSSCNILGLFKPSPSKTIRHSDLRSIVGVFTSLQRQGSKANLHLCLIQLYHYLWGSHGV